MHILITGGAGFIGSHTCLTMLENGYEISVIDSFSNSTRKSFDGIIKILKINSVNFRDRFNIFEGDLRDEFSIENIFQVAIKSGNPIQAVIHFAGLKSVPESFCKPIKYWENNVKASINLLSVMNSFDCKTIIFSSSAIIYSNTNYEPINEKQLIKPNSPYGSNKETIETLLSHIFENDSKSWRIANLRYFNPIGAHPTGIIGESPTSINTNIFPIISKVGKGEIKELKIFGHDWSTKDGTGIRDYIHVVDIAEGHLKALKYLSNNLPQLVNVNLGSGKGTSVLELIQTFEKTNNLKIPYSFAPRRIGDKGFLVADNRFAKKIFNWEPKKSLEDMCSDGWNYLLKN